MAEYIERPMLMGELTSAEMQKKMREMTGVEAYSAFLRMVNCAPAADVAPVRHGRWGITKPAIENAVCSCCGKHFQSYYEAYSYCPNCGAKMDGDGNGT